MNKISRRNFLKVAGAGAAAMGLAACGGSSSSSSSVAASSTAANAAADTLSGTIEYWSSWSETENQALVLKQAADAFTQLHPNVKINFTFNGRDNRNLVVSAIEAGRLRLIQSLLNAETGSFNNTGSSSHATKVKANDNNTK